MQLQIDQGNQTKIGQFHYSFPYYFFILFQVNMQDSWEVDLNIVIRLVKTPKGHNFLDSFQIKYIAPPSIDQLQTQQLVVRNKFISIDAAMRVWISGIKTYTDPVLPGDIMKALCIGQVIYSKSQKIHVGDLVLGEFNWQKYAVTNQNKVRKLPIIKNPQIFLGVLGISGLTAYFGINQIGKVKEGDIVAVSAAAGAVGQIALQLAKLKKAVVVAITGGKEKCAYVSSLGTDYVIDYKNESVSKRLKQCCPNGIDVYFDNVGGQMLDQILLNIRQGCRIVLCGAISGYNSTTPYRLKNYTRIALKDGVMKGFIFTSFKQKMGQAIRYLKQKVETKQITYREDIIEGLENCPKGLDRLLKGENRGKVIIKLRQLQRYKPINPRL